MKKVLIRSKQGGVLVSHTGNPSFNFELSSEPILVDEGIANFLTSDNSNFEIMGEVKPVLTPDLLSRSELIALNKKEQVILLEDYGITSEGVPKKEEDRVDLILKLQKERGE